MKKITSLFVVIALACSFMIASAQDKPKKDEAQAVKTECSMKSAKADGCCSAAKKVKSTTKKDKCDMKNCKDDCKMTSNSMQDCKSHSKANEAK
jgi:hypothetical protein